VKNRRARKRRRLEQRERQRNASKRQLAFSQVFEDHPELLKNDDTHEVATAMVDYWIKKGLVDPADRENLIEVTHEEITEKAREVAADSYRDERDDLIKQIHEEFGVEVQAHEAGSLADALTHMLGLDGEEDPGEISIEVRHFEPGGQVRVETFDLFDDPEDEET
jgi:primosomal protein N'